MTSSQDPASGTQDSIESFAEQTWLLPGHPTAQMHLRPGREVGCHQAGYSGFNLGPCCPPLAPCHLSLTLLCLCPPHLPTDKMVISPWRPALAPVLGALAGLGRSLGVGVVAAAASGDSSTSGHFWLQREQQRPESEARPCTVWRWW